MNDGHDSCERCSDTRRCQHFIMGRRAHIVYFLCARCSRDMSRNVMVRNALIEESSMLDAYYAGLQNTADAEEHRRLREVARLATIRLHNALAAWQATWG